ncbi:hypothetical protein BN3661_02066 [Eubacteriaceae bacterium CHKCI005]|nr:hypothetical protein BN3661_02066 [Eubacteriaceae bacterium CHKCI005]
MENNQAFELIKERISPILAKVEMPCVSDEETDDQKGRKAVFASSEQAIVLQWDAQQKKYRLSRAAVENGKVSDSPKQLALWLFDPDTNDLTDAKSIANDFEDTVNDLFTSKRAISQREEAKSRNRNTLEGMIHRFMETYPQFQDQYDAHQEKYGEIFPDTFIQEIIFPYLLDLLTQKKNAFIKRVFEIINESYTMGNVDLKSAITYTLFGMLMDYPEQEELALKYMDENLKRAWMAMRRLLEKDRAKGKKASIV